MSHGCALPGEHPTANPSVIISRDHDRAIIDCSERQTACRSDNEVPLDAPVRTSTCGTVGRAGPGARYGPFQGKLVEREAFLFESERTTTEKETQLAERDRVIAVR